MAAAVELVGRIFLLIRLYFHDHSATVTQKKYGLNLATIIERVILVIM